MSRRFRARFRVGTMLLFVAAVGTGARVVSDRATRAALQRRVVAAVELARGQVSFDWQPWSSHIRNDDISSGNPAMAAAPDRAPGPRWLEDRIGDEYFQEIVFVAIPGARATDREVKMLAGCRYLKGLKLCCSTRVTDAGIVPLADLGSMEQLWLDGTAISDDCLRTIGRFRRLQFLDLSGTRITDAGVVQLAHLDSLCDLRLAGTPITDEGIKRIAQMRHLRSLDVSSTSVGDIGVASLLGAAGLESLDLYGTGVTDRSVGVLSSMKALTKLNVSHTAVTEGALRALRAALPGCAVYRG